MLETLLKIIGKRQDGNSFSRADNPNFVTEADRIVKLIETIEANSQLCSVSIPGSKKVYSTSLIDFYPEESYLILDELSPIEGNSILQIVKALKLSAFVNGIHLSLQLEIMDYGLKQGIPYYKAALPKRIYYLRRRAAPRVFIGAQTLCFQARPTASAPPISGEVFDLSRSGLCINIAEKSVHIERGDILTSCQIALPNGFMVTFDLAVRSTKTVRHHKTQIGGYFLNMPSKSKRKLESYVALLERETIRKLKN